MLSEVISTVIAAEGYKFLNVKIIPVFILTAIILESNERSDNQYYIFTYFHADEIWSLKCHRNIVVDY